MATPESQERPESLESPETPQTRSPTAKPAQHQALEGRAAELVRDLGLQPHPEGGWYHELFRSSASVLPDDGRPARSGLTSIDFLLVQGQFSAWHRVLSDEVWHLLEGPALTLWLLPFEAPAQKQAQRISLQSSTRLRHVVPAGWWQAAEPAGALAYAGATVGPGFDFKDFSFGRDDPTLCEALRSQHPQLLRLL